jgi:proteasome lid subunit RPN8/RPN11
MKRLCYIVLIGLISAVFLEAQSAGSYAISNVDVNDCKIMMIFADIYDGSPLIKREKAAWIIVNSRGEFESVHWLNTPQEGRIFWTQVLPSNIVALVHTHPDFVDPRPSKQDQKEAQRLHICIFTLARKGIWSVTPEGVIRQHAGVGWLKNLKHRCANGV